MGIVYTVTTELALEEAQKDLSSSLDNVKKSVSSYEEYTLASNTRQLLSLKERARYVRDCLHFSADMRANRLNDLLKTQFVDGYLIFNGDEQVELQSSPAAWRIWKHTLGQTAAHNFKAAGKSLSFMRSEELNEYELDLAVIARDDADGFVFIYNDKSADSGVRMNVEDFLKGRYYRNNSILFLTDYKGDISFSGDPKLNGLVDLIRQDQSQTKDMKRIKLGGEEWFGMSRGYRRNVFYMFSPVDAVFLTRDFAMLLSVSFVGMFVFMLLTTLVYFQWKSKRREKKHEHILAITTKLFETVIIYDAMKDKWLAIKLPEKNQILFSEAKSVKDILKTVIRIYSTTDKNNEIIRFLDWEYLKNRLHHGLCTLCELEDSNGKWHCIRVEPCASSENKSQGSFLLTVYSADVVHREENELLAELKASVICRKNETLRVSSFVGRLSQSLKSSMSKMQEWLAHSERSCDDAEKVKFYRGLMQERIVSINSIMNALLTLVKLKIGKIQLDDTVFDLCYLLQDVSDTVAIVGKRSGVKVSYIRNGENELMVKGSQLHLRQILVHLMDNAIRYTPEGGSVQLRCREIFYCGRERWYELSVSDNGEGMSEEFKPKCFEVMAQEDPYAKNGLCGAGLAMVKHIVEQMSGCISVMSCKHVGTTFKLRLPFEAVCDVPKSGHEDISFEGKKVLLADDNEFALEYEEFVLNDLGFSVVCTRGSREALDLYEKSAPNEFSVIFLDIAMLDSDSCEVARIIRNSSRKDSMNTPIIAISPNAYVDDRGRCIEAGMNDCLSKPLNKNSLTKVLKKYL